MRRDRRYPKVRRRAPQQRELDFRSGSGGHRTDPRYQSDRSEEERQPKRDYSLDDLYDELEDF